MSRRILVSVAAVLTVVALAGCEPSGKQEGAQQAGQKQTETAFRQQSSAVPYPADQLRDSLERRNLRERLLRTNDPNRLQYVYLLGDTGTYLGYYAIKGKVSSNQSQMTTDMLVNYACDDGLSGCQANTVTAPGDDGSYGANEPGIFFFTVEGVMVATDLRYVVSDAPLAVDAPKLNVPKK